MCNWIGVVPDDIEFTPVQLESDAPVKVVPYVPIGTQIGKPQFLEPYVLGSKAVIRGDPVENLEGGRLEF